MGYNSTDKNKLEFPIFVEGRKWFYLNIKAWTLNPKWRGSKRCKIFLMADP